MKKTTNRPAKTKIAIFKFIEGFKGTRIIDEQVWLSPPEYYYFALPNVHKPWVGYVEDVVPDLELHKKLTFGFYGRNRQGNLIYRFIGLE